MKKILLLLIILVFVFQTPFSYAQVSSSSSDLKDIQQFKDKLASQVAQLAKKNDLATAGVVTSISSTALKIQTRDDTAYQIKIDKDLTKYYLIQNNQQLDMSFSDIKKGAYIIATGPIASQTVNANDIYQDEQIIVGSGKITEVNLTDYYIKILTSEKDTFTLDIKTNTKKNMIDIKTLELQPTTLSKVKEGDTLHFAAGKTGKEQEKNRYSALKILIIPQEYFQK